MPLGKIYRTLAAPLGATYTLAFSHCSEKPTEHNKPHGLDPHGAQAPLALVSARYKTLLHRKTQPSKISYTGSIQTGAGHSLTRLRKIKTLPAVKPTENESQTERIQTGTSFKPCPSGKLQDTIITRSVEPTEQSQSRGLDPHRAEPPGVPLGNIYIGHTQLAAALGVRSNIRWPSPTTGRTNRAKPITRARSKPRGRSSRIRHSPDCLPVSLLTGLMIGHRL